MNGAQLEKVPIKIIFKNVVSEGELIRILSPRPVELLTAALRDRGLGRARKAQADSEARRHSLLASRESLLHILRQHPAIQPGQHCWEDNHPAGAPEDSATGGVGEVDQGHLNLRRRARKHQISMKSGFLFRLMIGTAIQPGFTPSAKTISSLSSILTRTYFSPFIWSEEW
jgi:hypothetical protein